jgi:hypothetical protein
MPFTDACIYFIISILGLAYPIAIQVVSRLDEKYLSNNIIKMFRASLEWQAFRFTLVGTLSYVTFYLLYEEFWKSPLIAKSYHQGIDYWLLAVTILLIGSFLLYTRKIICYYVPAELVKYLRKKKDDESYKIFNAMADILYSSIKHKDDQVAIAVTDYIYGKFNEMREGMNTEAKPFPAPYYEVAYKTILQSADLPKKMQFVGFKAANGTWFFGEGDFIKIDQKTFFQMWSNLQLLVEHKLDDYLLAYWKKAYSFAESAYMHSDKGTPEEVKRTEEDRFLQFNFALGGKVLYNKRYDALKRMFKHSTGNTPFRKLLPDTMSTVFNLFIRFWDPYDQIFPFPYHITPDQNILGEGESKNWICQYIALLMYRQYTLPMLNVNYDPLVVTQIPIRQSDRQLWLDQLPFFKKFIIAVAEDEPLLKALNYDHLTDNWFIANHKKPPLDLIDQVIAGVQASFQAAEVEQPISEEKSEQFFLKSNEIISSRLATYQNLHNVNHISNNFDAGHIGAIYGRYEKYAFCDDQPVSTVDFDRNFASRYAEKISAELAAMFRAKIKNSWLLKWPDVTKGLDRLELKPNEHVILNFGVYIPTIIEQTKSKTISEDSYKGVPIIDFQFAPRRIMDRTLLVMKRSDLPRFFCHHITADRIKQYDLRLLNQDINLYGAVLDINEYPLLKQAFPEEPEDLLNKSVYLRLEMQLEVRFHKDIKCIAIHIFSDFDEAGIPNNVGEVGIF